MLSVKDGSTIAHFYTVLGGPDEWEFVMEGESFLVLHVLPPPEEDYWGCLIAVSNTGTVVVLSYPDMHGFVIS